MEPTTKDHHGTEFQETCETREEEGGRRWREGEQEKGRNSKKEVVDRWGGAALAVMLLNLLRPLQPKISLPVAASAFSSQLPFPPSLFPRPVSVYISLFFAHPRVLPISDVSVIQRHIFSEGVPLTRFPSFHHPISIKHLHSIIQSNKSCPPPPSLLFSSFTWPFPCTFSSTTQPRN
ncbi:hypothetical protein IE53DRAFT_137399 [Violaceomyces palustris]|uniref:Uncharacterized protein n=1 Tax=Violaceomyces palustris TaxID=1673888 RepID=A0ACD0P638_9BASI|nr:hypothetical protein IE53DRAFT_137399 [Violaceomyces palustris]